MLNRLGLLCLLVPILVLVVSGCAAPVPQAPPTPTPLSIPNLGGLPQPRSQPPAPPPIKTTVPAESQASSKVPPDLVLNPSLLPQAAPAEQNALLDIVGIWASQQQTAYGTIYTQVILERTGTYSMQAWWSDLLTYETGTYQVGDGFIHFMLTNYEPKIYKGRWMSRPMTWTAWYTIVDQNTMEWEDRIVKSRWTVYRQ